MEKEIILLRINQIEKQLNELKELLLSAETKTHDCNSNAEIIFDFNIGTSNAIRHRCKISGADIIPFNHCATHISNTQAIQPPSVWFTAGGTSGVGSANANTITYKKTPFTLTN